jgi:N-acetylneuraminate synthase
MHETVRIGDRPVGPGHPVFVIAEIGINHNGEIDLAKRLIDAAAHAGCDAVKLQKRTPDLCVPPEQRSVMRETPWGLMTYLDYRRRIELSADDFAAIDLHCRARGVMWFASCWDLNALDTIEPFQPPAHKIASACLTDEMLLRRVRATGRPVIASTGMSTMAEIRRAVSILGEGRLLLAHSTSAYPCRPAELNLRMIQTLRDEFDCPIGYSGHEVGLQTTIAAVVLGANFIERHLTLDRAMWGTDQAASIEPHGFARLVRDIRVVEQSLGDGVKRVYESEAPAMERLRRSVA